MAEDKDILILHKPFSQFQMINFVTIKYEWYNNFGKLVKIPDIDDEDAQRYWQVAQKYIDLNMRLLEYQNVRIDDLIEYEEEPLTLSDLENRQ